jgi:hypothetical protein
LLFLFKVAPTTLGAFEAYFAKTGWADTIAAGVACPPRPTLIETITTVLTRNPHKRKQFEFFAKIENFSQTAKYSELNYLKIDRTR